MGQKGARSENICWKKSDQALLPNDTVAQKIGHFLGIPVNEAYLALGIVNDWKHQSHEDKYEKGRIGKRTPGLNNLM